MSSDIPCRLKPRRRQVVELSFTKKCQHRQACILTSSLSGEKMYPGVFAALALATSLFVAAAPASFAADDLAKGLEAYQARDFGEALAHFRQAADDGDAEAQLHLGAMYFNGHGVAQDRDEAARWFRKAAIKGNLEAQHILGVIYWDGRGVDRDYVASYMWFDIASKNGSQSAADSVGRIAAKLSSPDISEAERRARACLESHYRDCN